MSYGSSNRNKNEIKRLVIVFIIIIIILDSKKYFIALKTLSILIIAFINSANRAYNTPIIIADKTTEIKLKIVAFTRISFIKDALCAPNIRNDENILEYCIKINLIPIVVMLIINKIKSDEIIINITLIGIEIVTENIPLY